MVVKVYHIQPYFGTNLTQFNRSLVSFETQVLKKETDAFNPKIQANVTTILNLE
ncbi:hypothetical protein FC98_GL000741 [Lentilactobacillus kisonensis DSM 19906 = JCM 15041]|uniref:Uncharacterized protein n=2 Tax=Lentilactobacillus kisonensis TaxID=481722 RepID=H1LCJ0_9LACO|nr:hypothetical protein HMPREF9104_00303 [Lentilactobacillus kisonensis F0435]KRL21565.1 hypothetical protein FC98_GL000741 [Lentilactobacillus kisonensis DSM 19906 = JCM 15041]